MDLHAKKQITVIAERPLTRRITRYFDEQQVTGYSVLPVRSGRGADGAWSREGLVGDAGQMEQTVCILDASRLDTVLQGLMEIVLPQSGVVTIQDVQVVRGDHF